MVAVVSTSTYTRTMYIEDLNVTWTQKTTEGTQLGAEFCTFGKQAVCGRPLYLYYSVGTVIY